MKRFLLLALLPLAGCANPYDTSHLSEAERAAAIQGLMARPQPQPYQVPAYQMQINRPTYTDCQRFGNQTTCTTR